jgi:hypothetical protein
MVEIAICLAIIGFALVAIIGILPIGMSVQKDNREETVINFDAQYLMNAIRSGSLGQDELTNYIISITDTYTTYDAKTNFQSSGVNWFGISTNGNGFYYTLAGIGNTKPFLTNGLNIIGLLTTPKWTQGAKGLIQSNFMQADFRAITGSPVDQGGSSSSRDFAFSYRVFPEIVPFGITDISLTNWHNVAGLSAADSTSRFAYATYATNLQPNLNEIRMRFRWPVLPNGQTGPGNQIYRSVVGGALRLTNSIPPTAPLYYFQPQTFVNGLPVYPPGTPFLP